MKSHQTIELNICRNHRINAVVPGSVNIVADGRKYNVPDGGEKKVMAGKEKEGGKTGGIERRSLDQRLESFLRW